MTPEMEEQAIALLRSSPDFTMPVAGLHLELAAQFGDDVGSPELLRESLARRPEIFLVFEPRTEPWMAALGSNVWAEIHSAMREAGWHAGPRVVLLRLPATDADPSTDAVKTLLELMRTTLVDVLARAPQDSDVHAVTAEALNAAGELRRALVPAPS